MDAKLKHLEFIEAVIGRMATNSFLFKGWAITIAAALASFATVDAKPGLLVIAIASTLMFWMLDGYYLWLERRFRALYASVTQLPEAARQSTSRTGSWVCGTPVAVFICSRSTARSSSSISSQSSSSKEQAVARRVFFSFEYENDVTRAMVVRNSATTQDVAGFIDAAQFEKIEAQGKKAIAAWIDGQLLLTTVTVVLFGQFTCSSEWVKYEIEQSGARGNGLLGIDISQIKNLKGQTTSCCGQIGGGYPHYGWYTDDGYNNLSAWIENAAKAAGK